MGVKRPGDFRSGARPTSLSSSFLRGFSRSIDSVKGCDEVNGVTWSVDESEPNCGKSVSCRKVSHPHVVGSVTNSTMYCLTILSSGSWFAGISASPLMQVVLLTAALALMGFAYFLRRFGVAWSMRSWHRTQGRILAAEMRRGERKSSDGSLLYDPVVRYSYSVGDRVFESSRFTHRTVSNAEYLATQFIRGVQKEAEVPIYYHPQDPALAVVRPMPWKTPAFGAAVCALIAALLVVSLVKA
jgi:hypothetical protein